MRPQQPFQHHERQRCQRRRPPPAPLAPLVPPAAPVPPDLRKDLRKCAQNTVLVAKTSCAAAQMQAWVLAGRLPAGTPPRATVAQVLPILRHVEASCSDHDKISADIPAPSDSCHVAATYMYD